MEGTRRPQVKICCIASEEEARFAIRCGASAIGLVSAMPSGPGVIADESIQAIAESVGRLAETFLLTCRQSVAGIVDQHRLLRTSAIQICDRLTEGSYADIREALPGVRLIQVVHVIGEDSIHEAALAAPFVDALLLDSGNQGLAIRELGGTGRRHDWQISRRIREVVDVPVYLAGGLRPDNVAEAIATVEPFGLDVCTGVRTAGALDMVKLQAFFRAVAGTAKSSGSFCR
jgi:phosphoribosylanthranilate isomerase